jgi:hypothetical protein
VNGNRVIGRVSHSVGFVITDHETLLAPQEVHQQMGKTGITVVEHADMPRPRDRLEHRRKAVHGDQRRRSARLSPRVQFPRNSIVIRRKYFLDARFDLRWAEPDISRHDREFAQFDNRRLGAGHAVAIDGEARVVLLDDHRIERGSDRARDRTDADIPSNVTSSSSGPRPRFWRRRGRSFPAWSATMTSGELPPALVTVTGRGSSGAINLVGMSCMGTHWIAAATGSDGRLFQWRKSCIEI